MRRSSVIDINGVFVGAAVEGDRSYSFVATHQSLEQLHGMEFPSLGEVKTAASAAFFRGRVAEARIPRVSQ